jgi:hypothetical protein
MRETSNLTWPTNSYGYYAGPYMAVICPTPGTWTMVWNGYKENNNPNGTFVTEPGTYTFDIGVWETPEYNNWTGSQIVDDWQWMKYNYYLWIPETFGPDNTPGHTFEIVEDTAADEERVRISYYFCDIDGKPPTLMEVYVLDDSLERKAIYSTTNVESNVHYKDIDVYTLREEDEGGDWRAIFTALDDHADLRRDHAPRRIVAVNGITWLGQADNYDANFAGSTLHDGGDYTPAAAIAASIQKTGSVRRLRHAFARSNAFAGLAHANLHKDSVFFIYGHAATVGSAAFYTPSPLYNPKDSGLFAHPIAPYGQHPNGEITPEGYRAFYLAHRRTRPDSPPLDLSKVVLAVFGNCNSFDESASYGSNARYAFQLGAKTTVGFTGTGPCGDDVQEWWKIFWRRWMGGSSVVDALNGANADFRALFKHHPSDPGYDWMLNWRVIDSAGTHSPTWPPPP